MGLVRVGLNPWACQTMVSVRDRESGWLIGTGKTHGSGGGFGIGWFGIGNRYGEWAGHSGLGVTARVWLR
jgi:hypothetical protein